MPKAIETVADVLKRKRKYKSRNWHQKAIVFLAWAIIAIFTLRGFYQRRKQKRIISQQDTQKESSEKSEEKATDIFDGTLGSMLNL